MDVRETKKRKPYVVCDPCGVQMFVRGARGIERFEALVSKAKSGHVFDRLAEMERRYRKKCPRCAKTFWVGPGLVKTSWVDGSFQGYRCPEPDCDGIATEEEDDK